MKLHLLQSKNITLPSWSAEYLRCSVMVTLWWIKHQPQKTTAWASLFPCALDLDKRQDVIPFSTHRQSCEARKFRPLSSTGAILLLCCPALSQCWVGGLNSSGYLSVGVCEWEKKRGGKITYRLKWWEIRRSCEKSLILLDDQNYKENNR